MTTDSFTTELSQALGLDVKESAVYLAALKTGASSVQAIAAVAGVERTGTYDVLERLARRGLLRVERVGKRAKISVESPEAIRTVLTQRLRRVESLVPKLQELYHQTVDNFSIERQVGEAGLRLFNASVSEAVGTVQLTVGATSVADGRSTRVELDALTPLFLGKTTRVLASPALSPATREWMEQLHVAATVRSLPSPTPLPSSQLITDDTVVTVAAGDDDLIVTKVVSAPLADHQRSLFEAFWRSAKPLRS